MALPEAHFISREWVISGHQHIRVRLSERPAINLYTSVEIMDLKTSAWTLVPGSARGHGLNLTNAEARVERLLADGWREWVENVPASSPSVHKLQTLWTTAEEWCGDFPNRSSDELARAVRKIFSPSV